MAERHLGVQPPAGPPKLDLTHGADVFFKNFGVMNNISFGLARAQTYTPTQRIHFWIAYDLKNGRKLVPCQTNSRILKYFIVSDQNEQILA